MQLKLLTKQDSSSSASGQQPVASGSTSPDAQKGSAGGKAVGSANGGGAGDAGDGAAPCEPLAAIRYGDVCEMVAKKIRPRREGVVRAPVTHLRRRRQIPIGGFLRSDGKGKVCEFTIHHAPPRISMVSFFFCLE